VTAAPPPPSIIFMVLVIEGGSAGQAVSTMVGAVRLGSRADSRMEKPALAAPVGRTFRASPRCDGKMLRSESELQPGPPASLAKVPIILGPIIA
jgi:hypothetical protein